MYLAYASSAGLFSLGLREIKPRQRPPAFRLTGFTPRQRPSRSTTNKQPTHTFTQPCIHTLIHTSIHPPHPFTHPSTHTSIHPPFHSVTHPFIHPSIHSFHASLHPFILATPRPPTIPFTHTEHLNSSHLAKWQNSRSQPRVGYL